MGHSPESDPVTAEYYNLQDKIDSFNEHCLTIKNWSVTVSAVGLGTAYLEAAPALLWVAALTALIFWRSETYWRANQWAFIKRIREIEDHLKAAKEGFASPYISHAWDTHWRTEGGWKGQLRHFTDARTRTPHLWIVGLAVVLRVVFPPGGAALDLPALPLWGL